MKKVFLIVSLLCSVSFANSKYYDMCRIDYAQELSDEIDARILDVMDDKVSDFLITAFADSGILISQSNIQFQSIDKVDPEKHDYLFTVTTNKTYTFAATIRAYSSFDLDWLVNVGAKDNEVVNAIGEIVQPATQLKCNAHKSLRNRAWIRNKDTDKSIGHLELGSFISGYFNVQGFVAIQL